VQLVTKWLWCLLSSVLGCFWQGLVSVSSYDVLTIADIAILDGVHQTPLCSLTITTKPRLPKRPSLLSLRFALVWMCQVIVQYIHELFFFHMRITWVILAEYERWNHVWPYLVTTTSHVLLNYGHQHRLQFGSWILSLLGTTSNFNFNYLFVPLNLFVRPCIQFSFALSTSMCRAAAAPVRNKANIDSRVPLSQVQSPTTSPSWSSMQQTCAISLQMNFVYLLPYLPLYHENLSSQLIILCSRLRWDRKTMRLCQPL